MANRIYTIGGGYAEQSAPGPKNIYIDLDSVAVHDGSTQKKQIREFILYLIEWYDMPVNDGAYALAQNLADVLSQLEIQDAVSKLAEAFAEITGRDVSYDNISELYNQYLQSGRYRVGRLVDIAAVKNSLKQIFTWIPGERVLNPEFGSRLMFYLYEQITDENQESIIAEIKNCITKWEPRVSIVSINKATSLDDEEQNTVNIEIKYNIKGFTQDKPYTYMYSQKISNQ